VFIINIINITMSDQSNSDAKVAADVPVVDASHPEPNYPEPVAPPSLPSSTDPLVDQLRKELSLVVDVKHLNVSNILTALTKGMHIVKDLKTTTNEQKKILLLKVMGMIIRDSSLGQSTKDDLIWVVDEMGPAAIELFLAVAGKGVTAFKNANKGCFTCC
jgi:hypothetical protein